MITFAIYKDKAMVYVGLHDSEEDCWQVFGGWPHRDEIEAFKKDGYRLERVKCERCGE